jgi:fructose/tagatose bisphosphate aldolase
MLAGCLFTHKGEISMVSYKELGLVNTREMFAKAVAGGYAIPAFNFNNMEQLQAIIMAAAETKSPVILQVSRYRPRMQRSTEQSSAVRSLSRSLSVTESTFRSSKRTR